MQIDTKVIVWDSEAFGKHNRHFAKFNHEGKIECFRSGKTSWSGKSIKAWDNYEIVGTSQFITNIQ